MLQDLQKKERIFKEGENCFEFKSVKYGNLGPELTDTQGRLLLRHEAIDDGDNSEDEEDVVIVEVEPVNLDERFAQAEVAADLSPPVVVPILSATDIKAMLKAQLLAAFTERGLPAPAPKASVAMLKAVLIKSEEERRAAGKREETARMMVDEQRCAAMGLGTLLTPSGEYPVTFLTNTILFFALSHQARYG